MKLRLDVQHAVRRSNVPSNPQLKQWAELALKNRVQQSEVEVCVRIVAAEESQTLNGTWRGKHYPTNVLSFPMDAPPGIESNFIGDIIICAEVLEQEALEQDKDLDDHWAHIFIHGLLHLLGYDHIEPEEAEQMESIEIKLLSQLQISNPYENPLRTK